MANTDKNVVEWLLEERDPSVRYRALTELLDRPADDADVIAAKAALPQGRHAQRIFKKMHPDGYWLQKKSSTGKLLGDGVEYGSFATTHFVLAYLAELGFDASDPRVARAANRYLDLQAEDGDFWLHMSCLNGYNIRTFIMLGMRDDPRVQRIIDLMLSTERADGGYLCDMHEGKYKTRETRSCYRGSGKMLMAFAELPEYWEHRHCLALVEYFLSRGGIFQKSDKEKPVTREAAQTYFPFTWGASLLDVLYAMSKMGYGRDPRLARTWQVLEDKRDTQERYLLDWTPSQAPLKAGKRGEANKWVTLYALLAHQHCAPS